MALAGFALLIIGYAALYAGASNLMTGGQGWGFLQSLLNKGTGNQSLSGIQGLFSGGGSGGSGAVGQAIGGATTIAKPDIASPSKGSQLVNGVKQIGKGNIIGGGASIVKGLIP